MTPPIGFRTTDKTGNSKGILNEIRPATVTNATAPEALRQSATSTSRTADYTYRIAALAAGLALLASVW